MRYLLAFVVAFMLGIGYQLHARDARADPAAICCSQPGPDQFTVAPYGNLDQFNPLSRKVREQGLVRWSYVVVSGCQDGLGPVIGRAMGNIYEETGVRFEYASSGPVDLTIRANCGVSLYAICGQVTGVNCLGRGFPSVLDIDLNTDILSYFDQSQVAVVLHELMGHALATWDEGYCTQAGTPAGCTGRFAAVPNYVDFMNTGPLSRHYIGDSERARWGRTQGAGAPKSYGAGDGFIYVCDVGSKAIFIALYGNDGITYRYIGSIAVNLLRVSSDGCAGIATNGYVQPNERPCFDLWNLAVTNPNQGAFRYDRCL